jgi:hypothetical protein
MQVAGLGKSNPAVADVAARAVEIVLREPIR